MQFVTNKQGYRSLIVCVLTMYRTNCEISASSRPPSTEAESCTFSHTRIPAVRERRSCVTLSESVRQSRAAAAARSHMLALEHVCTWSGKRGEFDRCICRLCAVVCCGALLLSSCADQPASVPHRIHGQVRPQDWLPGVNQAHRRYRACSPVYEVALIL